VHLSLHRPGLSGDNVQFLECPDCNEQLFDHTAMQKIEAHSPAYAKRRAAEKKTAAAR
jgi:hypothetical protein